MGSIDLVAQFHQRFNQPIEQAPSLGNDTRNLLRLNLIAEELRELGEALGYYTAPIDWTRRDRARPDAVEAIDALTDLQYVLDGTYLELGLGLIKDAAFCEVHRSNMSKLGPDGKPIVREDGKILKPATYSPADLAGLMAIYYG